MKPVVFILVVALLVAVTCGNEEQETLDDLYEVAKRGKAALRANPYYRCINKLTGAQCVCNRLYRKESSKHQTLCFGD